MTLYLDSGSPGDVRQAAEFGFIAGVTTNPKLLARVDQPAEQVLLEMCDALSEGTVFYQLTAATLGERREEAQRIASLRPGRIGLKIPCTTENLTLVPDLTREGLICGVTAIFSAHQTLLACQAGADFVIPYVNRATRQLGDGIGLVEEMADVIEALSAPTEILAASFHSLAEVVAAVRARADHVTLPPALLKKLGDHPLSERAIEEFSQYL